MKRLKAPEEENRRLKKPVADLSLDKQALQAVGVARTELGLTERRACTLVRMDRSSFSLRSRRGDESELRERLRMLAAQRPRFGARRLGLLLRREGRLVSAAFRRRS